MQHNDVLHLALVKYYDNPKTFDTMKCKWAFFRQIELNMSWKTPCLRIRMNNNADFAMYVIYNKKYPDNFQNKMAFTDCETCQFIKFLKTAGLCRCQRENSNFL